MTSIRTSIINKISKNQNQNQEAQEVKPEKEKAVDFLVFVVHGVGEAKRHYKKVKQFEEYAKEYIKAEYGDKYSVHFIAIRWHDELHDLNTVDKRLNAITLDSCQAIRSLTSNFMGDVLFYFTAYHGQRIISAVVELMNNAYNEYISQHPDFKGKVILFGHSLGGVILYDILVNQDFNKLKKFRAYDKDETETKDTSIPVSPNGNCFSETEEIYSSNDFNNIINDSSHNQTNTSSHQYTDSDSFDSVNLTENQIVKNLYLGNGEVVFPSINFYPDFLYACGSSISAAMIMRCQYYQDYHLPEHMVFQNIYNRTDPFAYRYEPMVDENLQNLKPVFIKNININSNTDYDSTGPNTPRSAGSNPPSLFVSLRERFSNKLNHSPVKAKSYPEPKGEDSEKSPISPLTQDVDQKDLNVNFMDNAVLSPKSVHSSDVNGDIDTDLSLSTPSSPALSCSSSINSPTTKQNDASETMENKRKLTESPTLYCSEEVQANGKINEIQQYHCTSPGNETVDSMTETETRFISTQGPRDLLSSNLCNTQITNTTVTVAPTSPKMSALENVNQIHVASSTDESNIKSPPKKNSDGLLNRVSRFFSQGSNDNDNNNNNNNNTTLTRSPSSQSLSSDASGDELPSETNDTVPESQQQNLENPVSTNNASEGNNSSFSKFKKKTAKRLPSFMTYSEYKKKNSISSAQKRNSESKSPNGNEHVNIPLPDGRIAFENHPLLKYRVDYVLQENISDVIKGSYVTALGAHTSYWQNRFLIYHIMKSIITKTEYDQKEKEQANLPSPLM